MIKAAVFDMDGLMFDTERLVYNNWQRMMDESGYPYSMEDFKQTVGRRKAEVQNFYFGKYGEDFPYWEFSERGRKMYVETVRVRGIPVKKGLREVLDYLKKQGCKIAVATSTSRQTTEFNLVSAGMTADFDALVCGGEVQNGKPNPEVFLKAAAALGVAPEVCVAFEDSINGVKSAHAAGMTTGMGPDFLAPTDEIRPMIDCLCDSLDESIFFLEKERMQS